MTRQLSPVEVCVAEIRAKAEELRGLADEGRARALEWAAEKIELALRDTAGELLSLEEAATASGYHPDSLSRMIRDGRIPDLRPAGSHGPIVIRRADLPIRPKGTHNPHTDVVELASRLGIRG